MFKRLSQLPNETLQPHDWFLNLSQFSAVEAIPEGEAGFIEGEPWKIMATAYHHYSFFPFPPKTYSPVFKLPHFNEKILLAIWNTIKYWIWFNLLFRDLSKFCHPVSLVRAGSTLATYTQWDIGSVPTHHGPRVYSLIQWSFSWFPNVISRDIFCIWQKSTLVSWPMT